MTSAPDTADLQAEMAALRAFSAAVGSDPSLTQAAGGNTSIKDGDTLWIKASGTWLAHALERDIMVPVEMMPLLAAVEADDPAAEQAHRFTIAARNPSGLRPSIETTVHALMRQRVVAHVHCVDTIALAVRTDAVAELGQRLDSFNWAYVPYHRPGLPLAKGIALHRAQRPDVLILGNHGLVVAAESVAEAEALLRTVKQRLRQDARPTPPADTERLSQLAAGGYRLPTSDAAHAVALDPTATKIAAGGSLYPDHVIFLGVGSAVAQPGETPADVQSRIESAPASILFPGLGVLMREDASAGADAMARCLADVTTRIPKGAPLRYLSEDENHELTNWDAEKYRQKLDAAAAKR
ncbi:class II aldolase/adducin family protein [Ollibium composti]|uniref:Class II aldolase n=1 Tax=Ollibium composti TaxID=2675109 RepID=A0ABY2Q7K0_9HYPH|nr:class II aldolase/adducin family protein [Mesorhizobium composti]THF56382.1 class II aldolase [Mesorhizobium composti]